MTARIAVGGLGVLLMAYGALLALTRQSPGQLVEVAAWLAAGVAIHDGLLSGLLLLAGLLGRRLLPDAWRGPAAVALVVWGSLTIAVVPVLGRFGARPDNPTLLDRPYGTAWLALLAATILLVGLAGALRAHRAPERTARGAD